MLDAGQFAKRATASLADPAVRDFLGTMVADAAIEREPDLVAVGPLIRGAAASVAEARC